MPISPFGWVDNSPPYIDAANLELMLGDAGSYTDAQISARVVEGVHTVGTSGASQTIPEPSTAGVTLSVITLTASCTLTLPTPAAGKSCTIVTAQNGTGGWMITWATPSGSIKWPGGASPTYTSAASAIDATTFLCADGTNWLGMPVGYNFS